MKTFVLADQWDYIVSRSEYYNSDSITTRENKARSLVDEFVSIRVPTQKDRIDLALELLSLVFDQDINTDLNYCPEDTAAEMLSRITRLFKPGEQVVSCWWPGLKTGDWLPLLLAEASANFGNRDYYLALRALVALHQQNQL